MAKTLESIASGTSPVKTRPKMSFEEFLAWDGGPDDAKHFEWVDGEAVEMVSVTYRHADIVSFVSALLRGIGENGALGIACGEPFLMRLKDSARSPDVLFLRNEHRDRIVGLYVDGPADIAIEVVSPGSVKADYLTKRAEYERGGVPEYWIIDPINRQTAFLILDDQGVYHEADLDSQGLYASAALDGLQIDPAWFHQEPLPNFTALLKNLNLL